MTLVTAYKPLPLMLERGQGAYVWDIEGNQYIDAYCGVATSSLGHAHPKLLQAIQEQSQKIMHCANGVTIPQQLALAEKLTELTGMEQAFFGNSGAEANESAIKLARMYGHKRNISKPLIIVTEGAFHGRTMATLTASGNRKGQAGYEPLLPGFIRAPFNDIAALETIAKNSQDIVAVMVEPIQGESGIHVPADDYLNAIRDLCDQNEWLMILDEVQTGNGRTGKLLRISTPQYQTRYFGYSKRLRRRLPCRSVFDARWCVQSVPTGEPRFNLWWWTTGVSCR